MKYNNSKTVVDGITFDSKKEAKRYTVLKSLQDDGYIKDLKLQVPFELLPKGNGERSVRYIADFTYYDVEKNINVVEDVKGFKTDVYKLKRKLFKYRYPEYTFIETWYGNIRNYVKISFHCLLTNQK